MFMSVDFPDPDDPMTAIISPGITVRSRPFSAVTRFAPVA